MKTLAKKRRKKVRGTMGFCSKCSLREANGRTREGEGTRKIAGSSKRPLWEVALCPEYEDRVRAGSFHCPAGRVSQGQKVGFLLRTFQFLGEPPPPRVASSASTPANLLSRDIFKRGTLLSSRNVILGETCAPFARIT